MIDKILNTLLEWIYAYFRNENFNGNLPSDLRLPTIINYYCNLPIITTMST